MVGDTTLEMLCSAMERVVEIDRLKIPKDGWLAERLKEERQILIGQIQCFLDRGRPDVRTRQGEINKPGQPERESTR